VSSDQIYLLDTSIVIRVLRRRPIEKIARRVGPLIESGAASSNDVVRTELLIGSKTPHEVNQITRFLGGLRELRVTPQTWDSAAKLGFQLRRKGVTATVTDLLIASSAIEVNAIVMHVDGDFDAIAEHCDLRVESYVERPNVTRT